MATRKNLVIIIDRSGSMSRAGRIVLAKDAALTVLETLTADDYVSTSVNNNNNKNAGKGSNNSLL